MSEEQSPKGESFEIDTKKVRKPRSQGAKNRANGHGAERLYAKFFRGTGWEGFEDCQTARYESRKTDNCKVDLVNIPINAQIKAGQHMGMKPREILKSMRELILSSFKEGNPIRTAMDIIIHHKDVPVGHKRTEYDSMVYMTFKTYSALLDKLYGKGVIVDNTVITEEDSQAHEFKETTENS